MELDFLERIILVLGPCIMLEVLRRINFHPDLAKKNNVIKDNDLKKKNDRFKMNLSIF